VANREELLRQAGLLDSAASTYRDGGPKADALLAQAAALRIEALGPKPYPVEVCNVCFQITGWVAADGACATDIRRRLDRSDSNALYVFDRHIRAVEAPAPLLRRMKRGLGVGGKRDRIREWLTRVESDETGPVLPEEGWTIEWPVKGELPAPVGPGLLVMFGVQSYQFGYGAWRPVDANPHGRPRRLMPREFSAGLPIEALAEAWNDFKEEVAEHNRLVWQEESDRREGREQIERDRRIALESERGTSDLLGD